MATDKKPWQDQVSGELIVAAFVLAALLFCVASEHVACSVQIRSDSIDAGAR